jgi:hypothetical protein
MGGIWDAWESFFHSDGYHSPISRKAYLESELKKVLEEMFDEKISEESVLKFVCKVYNEYCIKDIIE